MPRRVRHVQTENQRVRDFTGALERSDLAAAGALLLASHASLRDDYEVSTPELDALTAALEAAGAAGARLTGAGFGGCVIAVADRSGAEDIAAEAVARYREETGREPTAFLCRAADGAGPVEGG